jgi:hypothetical protein
MNRSFTQITYNEQVKLGGCVTRCKHRAGSWYFSQKAVTVHDFIWEPIHVSGCRNLYKIVLRAGAKTVTSDLPILSVLADRLKLKC